MRLKRVITSSVLIQMLGHELRNKLRYFLVFYNEVLKCLFYS
jgi:hypothetical protein